MEMPRRPDGSQEDIWTEYYDEAMGILAMGCSSLIPTQRLLRLQAAPGGRGTLARVHATVRERVGIRLNRKPWPRAGVIDGQSVL